MWGAVLRLQALTAWVHTVFKRTSRWRCPILPTFFINTNLWKGGTNQLFCSSSKTSIACECPAVFCSVFLKWMPRQEKPIFSKSFLGVCTLISFDYAWYLITLFEYALALPRFTYPVCLSDFCDFVDLSNWKSVILIFRFRDIESDLETSQFLQCYIAKALIKFPDFCNEARCRQFSAKVSNSPNVITQPLQKVIFHQSSSHILMTNFIKSFWKFIWPYHPTTPKNHNVSNEIFFYTGS